MLLKSRTTRKLICIVIFLLIARSSFAQELELCGSIGSSSEMRFKDAYGIGFQYQQGIGKKFKLGLGTHYYYNNAHFTTESQQMSGDQYSHYVTRYDVNSQRFSLRLNMQVLLRDNDFLSVSLGPEVSYNFVWGQEDNSIWYGAVVTNRYYYSRYLDLAKKIGVGLISKIEIKDFINPRLSLCLTLRPEILLRNGPHTGSYEGSRKIYSAIIDFSEFQIGLKYRFKD